MDIRFWPTLQMKAYVRIAKGILYTFDLENLKNRLISFNNAHDYIQQMEHKVYIVLSFFISSVAPNEFEEIKRIIETIVHHQLVGVVRTMGMEIRNWYMNHRHILNNEDLDLRNKLTWFSFGIIDNIKSAQNFIQDNNLNIGERFHLACMYYFEDDVKMLHGEMSVDDFELVLKCVPKIRCMELWLKALDRGGTLNWGSLSLSERQRGIFFESNYLGIRNYFTKLRGDVMRNRCIIFASEEWEIHSFDLYLCLIQTKMNDLNKIFIELDTEDRMFIFKSFLSWPLQSLFLDFAKKFETFINAKLHCDVLDFILFHKLGTGWKDYPYEDLLEGFIVLGLADYLQQVRKNRELFAALAFVVTSSKPLNLGEYRMFLQNLNLN